MGQMELDEGQKIETGCDRIKLFLYRTNCDKKCFPSVQSPQIFTQCTINAQMFNDAPYLDDLLKKMTLETLM